MSDDLIRRSDAVNELAKFLGVPARAFIHEAEKLLKDVPSAQRKGKWLFVEHPDDYYHAECSECGQWADEDVYLKGKWNYCPNCGAEMRQDDPSHPFTDSVMMKGEEDG